MHTSSKKETKNSVYRGIAASGLSIWDSINRYDYFIYEDLWYFLQKGLHAKVLKDLWSLKLLCIYQLYYSPKGPCAIAWGWLTRCFCKIRTSKCTFWSNLYRKVHEVSSSKCHWRSESTDWLCFLLVCLLKL